MYYIVFSGIISSLYTNLTDDTTSIFAHRNFYLLVYAVINFPLIFKRTIKDLNIIGKIHYVAAKLFVGTLVLKLVLYGTSSNSDTDYTHNT